MIDTHAHLQFEAFKNNVDEVIKRAKESGVEKIIIVGTNLETSKKAIELAEKYNDLYASIGLHPHHIFSFCHSGLPDERSEGGRLQIAKQFDKGDPESSNKTISELERLIHHPKVIAVGETGLDRHIYQNTKYQNYQISPEFIELQKLFFKEQIKLAIKHKKTLIIHNREAAPELLEVLEENWDPFLENRSVFHCCEPNQKLLDFALKHKVFIGIDGDITYDKQKQDFIKKIPLELLVLETDSPYFAPEPLRHSREGANPISNEPKNLSLIAHFLTILTNRPIGFVRKLSSENSSVLFKL